ncbi:MAG: hypothetical protein IAE79_07060 [Anaerolinea sp.]|nr:hypothetical protein [Anaerolinea sp.]
MKRLNPLLNRVRRHAQFSTLFHTVQAAPMPPVANVAQVVTPIAATGYEGDATAVSHTIQRAIEVAETGAALPTPYQVASAQPALLTTALSATPLSTTPSPPSSQPSTVGQSDWRRLQRIAQGHQQKATGAPTATGAVTPAPTPAGAPVQTPPQTAVPIVQPKTEEEANWRRLQSIFNAHQQKTTAVAQPPTTSPPVTSTPVTSTPIPSTTTTIPTASTPDVSRAIETAETTRADAPLAAPPLAAPPRHKLEEAWPVRRRPGSPTPTSAALPEATPPEQPAIRANRGETAAVQTRLDQVTTGRPTASSVELHLPRRPRPPAPASIQPQRDTAQPAPTPTTIPTAIGPLPADMWEILGHTPPTSDKPTPDDALQRAITTAETAPTAPTTAVPTPDAARQRAIATAETTPTAPATAVPTPDAARQRATATAETAPAAAVPTPDAALQRAIAAAETPARTTTPEAAASLAQRQPTPAAASTTMRAASVPPTTPSPPTLTIQRAEEAAADTSQIQEIGIDMSELEAEGNINVDQLARLVYQQLQRRLAVERERGRGRLKTGV